MPCERDDSLKTEEKTKPIAVWTREANLDLELTTTDPTVHQLGMVSLGRTGVFLQFDAISLERR